MTVGTFLGMCSDAAPVDRTLPHAADALRDFASRAPDRVAIVLGTASLTYRELDRAVDATALLVVDRCPADSFVGLRFNDGVDYAIATLAVARAGRTSVPLDPTAPPELLISMVDATEMTLVLTDSVPADAEAELGRPVLALAVRRPAESEDVSPVHAAGASIAGVVFTSGSTGAPKGILIPPAMRQALAQILGEGLDLRPGRRVAMLSAGSVGPSELMFHVSVSCGASLHLFDVRVAGLAPFRTWLRDADIEAATLVPTVVRHMAADGAEDFPLPHLRRVWLFGESVAWEDVALLRRWMPRGSQVINAFGQTETVAVTKTTINPHSRLGTGPLPIGEVVGDSIVRIVDAAGREVAEGEPGEVVVESGYCALGYLNDPEQTARVFTDLGNGRRRVRTGDRAVRERGVLRYLGRIDAQVQIGGVRVELGDIESALRRLDDVAAAAAATYLDRSGQTRLVAFAVPRTGSSLDGAQLRDALVHMVARHALPDRVIVVDELPQMSGGKIDRSELHARAEPERTSRSIGADEPLVEMLTKLFASVLDIDDVTPKDDFFELGGDSLRAMRLFVRIEQMTGIEAPASLIFTSATPQALAGALAERGWGQVAVIEEAGSRMPLVFVHDGHGEIMYVRAYSAYLPDDQPILAVRPFESEDLLAQSIPDLAAGYIKHLREVWPEGPYALYGHSLGGLIAFEMTRQLELGGKEVAVLGLGDSFAPEKKSFGPGIVARARGRWRELQLFDNREKVSIALNLLKRQARAGTTLLRAALEKDPILTGATPATAEDHVVRERRVRVLTHLAESAFSYLPESRISAPIALLRADPAHNKDHGGWAAWTTSGVEVIAIPGNHFTFDHARAAQHLGQVVDEATRT
ncbi:AMP-binding protein [Humibacter sp.]|uniref:AMP-binding protein n=1 Tax=Humibacter sp. TaxID=1940291 RepID=UPI002BEF0496|nr:AMP-binding protein [Humibacter sp.]HVX07928.1 AMP-binding protein [Humibacter sp.]